MARRIIPIVVALSLVGYFGYQAWHKRQMAKADQSFYGTVEAVETMVSAQLSGRIMELNAIEGRTVEEGEVIARIDDAIYRAQLKQAEAGREAAESQIAVLDAQIALIDQNLGRARRLYHAQAAPRATSEDLALQRKALVAQKEAAEKAIGQADAAVALAKEQLGYAVVTSPVAGRAVVVHVERGELAIPGGALATIADLTSMEVRIYVPEPMLGKIKLGDKVKIKNDTYPERPMAGEVSYISDQAEFTPKNVQTKDERTRLVYAVKVTVDNEGGVLKIGMPVDAYFE